VEDAQLDWLEAGCTGGGAAEPAVRAVHYTDAGGWHAAMPLAALSLRAVARRDGGPASYSGHAGREPQCRIKGLPVALGRWEGHGVQRESRGDIYGQEGRCIRP